MLTYCLIDTWLWIHFHQVRTEKTNKQNLSSYLRIYFLCRFRGFFILLNQNMLTEAQIFRTIRVLKSDWEVPDHFFLVDSCIDFHINSYIDMHRILLWGSLKNNSLTVFSLYIISILESECCNLWCENVLTNQD